MKLNSLFIFNRGFLLCSVCLANLIGNTTAGGELASFEMIHFVKKDVHFRDLERSWGGVARITGRFDFGKENEILITADESSILATYAEGMKKSPETPVRARVAEVGPSSGSIFESIRVSEIFESGDRGLVVATLPMLNAINLDRKLKQDPGFGEIDNVEPIIFRSILEGSELLLTRHKRELRVVNVPGRGQKIPDIASIWLLSKTPDLSAEALNKAFTDATPSFEISFGRLFLSK
jgi:hypothetical protein